MGEIIFKNYGFELNNANFYQLAVYVERGAYKLGDVDKLAKWKRFVIRNWKQRKI